MSLVVRDAPVVLEALAHVLAHVPPRREMGLVERAASLYEPRYVAWARAALPQDAVASAELDAALLSTLLARPGASAVQLLFVLFDDDARVLAGGARSLAELARRGELDPSLARALGEHEPAVELVRAAALLAAPSLDRALRGPLASLVRRAHDEVARAWARVGLELPCARRALEVSLLLGPRGRALGPRVVVGGPAPFHDGSAERAAQQALHEVAVEAASQVVAARSGEARHAAIERLALDAVALAVAGTSLDAARRELVASLDLSALPPVGQGYEAGALEAVVAALRSP